MLHNHLNLITALFGELQMENLHRHKINKLHMLVKNIYSTFTICISSANKPIFVVY